MRVITGSARGVTLKTPQGQATRPTTERVKEALFSAIQFDIPGARVLDLFAGTGQLGIEALSRGAQRAVFVDQQKAAADLVRENLRRTRLTDRAQVIQGEYGAYIAQCREKFDIIFLDPPYAETFLENALKRISEIDILSDNGIIVAESPVGKTLPGDFPGLFQKKSYRYGITAITLYGRSVAGGTYEDRNLSGKL